MHVCNSISHWMQKSVSWALRYMIANAVGGRGFRETDNRRPWLLWIVHMWTTSSFPVFRAFWSLCAKGLRVLYLLEKKKREISCTPVSQ